jgi:hypothetical protein
MSGVSVWRTLKALGLSAQRPKYAAYQQNEEAVTNFFDFRVKFSRSIAGENYKKSQKFV